MTTTNTIGTSSLDTDLNPLVQQLAKHADLNKDGKVTGAEFISFLMDILQSTVASSGSAGASTAASTVLPSAIGAGATATTGTGTTGSTGATGTALPPCPNGWDPTKWADPTHTTPKYVIGRILWQYPPTPAGLDQAMPKLQAAMPGLTRDGDDTLNVPGVGVVDVGIAFSNGGGVGWTWLPADS